MYVCMYVCVSTFFIGFRRPETDVCVLVDVVTEPDETEAWGEGGVVLKQGQILVDREEAL